MSSCQGHLVQESPCKFLGAGSGLVPMYLTEIAPINIRGAMGVLHQLALTCGIIVSQLLGLRQVMGGPDFWPILIAASSLPIVLSCIVLPFYPDSPRWLLVKKGDRGESIKGKLEIYSLRRNVTANENVFRSVPLR